MWQGFSNRVPRLFKPCGTGSQPMYRAASSVAEESHRRLAFRMRRSGIDSKITLSPIADARVAGSVFPIRESMRPKPRVSHPFADLWIKAELTKEVERDGKSHIRIGGRCITRGVKRMRICETAGRLRGDGRRYSDIARRRSTSVTVKPCYRAGSANLFTGCRRSG